MPIAGKKTNQPQNLALYLREELFIYHLFALFTGVLISVMITANGGLTSALGLYSSTVVIHLVGMSIVIVAAIIKKVNPFKGRHAWYLYLGGVMGVIATAGNSYAFAPLGVSALLALGLLGQSTMGLIIDQFGLFGMPVHKLKKERVISFVIMLIGAVFMIRHFDALAMFLSFSVGAALVLQRTFNGALAQKTSLLYSTFYTYAVGIVCSVILLPFFAANEPLFTTFNFNTNWFYYMGGAIGTITVLTSIVCVSKVPSYLLSILFFVGQVFSGLIIDAILIGEFSTINLVGGIIVTVGLCTDVLLTKKRAKAKA